MDRAQRSGPRPTSGSPAPCLDPGPGPCLRSVSRHEYSFVSSEPLGRDQYKEMYLFVYR